MNQSISEVRYRVEWHDYTVFQRLRIWWRGILDAVKTVPDRKYGEYVQVQKGEFGYEDAPWSSVVCSNPLRYRFENGEYVQVDPESEPTEVNPDWTDGKTSE